MPIGIISLQKGYMAQLRHMLNIESQSIFFHFNWSFLLYEKFARRRGRLYRCPFADLWIISLNGVRHDNSYLVETINETRCSFSFLPVFITRSVDTC